MREQDDTRFELPPLPYPIHALEPIMSRETLELHHGRHHRTYLETLRGLVEDTALADNDLTTIVQVTASDPAQAKVFNNAAQAWNHAFFWESLRPAGGSPPEGDLAQALERDFGGLDRMQDALVAAAVGQFGSGWAWLIVDADGTLAVTATGNAQTPLTEGKTCLLTLDVWEHAYYVDYQNKREAYARAVVQNLLDWDRAAQRLADREATPQPAVGVLSA